MEKAHPVGITELTHGTVICPSHQPQAGLRWHGSGIEERVTHGHTEVIGHHGRKETFSTSTECEKEELGGTALKGDDHLISTQGLQQLRDNNRRVANVQEGKMAEEEVHGGLEATVTLNQHYHPQVTSYGDEIKDQKHKEETRLQLCPQLEPHQMNSVTTVPFSAMNPKLPTEIKKLNPIEDKIR